MEVVMTSKESKKRRETKENPKQSQIVTSTRELEIGNTRTGFKHI